MAQSPAEEHKAAGNDAFKAGDYLKAAAAYTKAIKADPANHVYYSNRSQAFLKLSKVTKALEDAEKCISLAPDFVKGYHRKASALHALGEPKRTQEAVDVLLDALEAGVDNNELVRLGIQIKGKGFIALADARRKGPADAMGENAPATANAPAPAPAPAPAKKKAAAVDPEKAAAAAAVPPIQPLWAMAADEFAGAMMRTVMEDFLTNGVSAIQATAFLQPARPAAPSLDQPTVAGAKIEHAFTNPQTLIECTEYLKKCIAQGGAQSAVIIVRKAQVGYPCVWKDKKKGSWPFPKGGDGIFMQCEAPNGERVICFTALEKDGKGATVVGETVQLDVSEFALFQPLFGVSA